MKALSIRQPWAWAILHAGKDIENRDWATKYRGTILIHASAGCTAFDFANACHAIGCIHPLITTPECANAVHRGGIVGMADIVDCVTKSPSPWFFGRYGFVLRNVRPVTFTPFKGKLGFFNAPDELARDA